MRAMLRGIIGLSLCGSFLFLVMSPRGIRCGKSAELIQATSNARQVFSLLSDYKDKFGKYPDHLSDLQKDGFIETAELFFVSDLGWKRRAEWIYFNRGWPLSTDSGPTSLLLLSPFSYEKKLVGLTADGSVRLERDHGVARFLGGEELKLSGKEMRVSLSWFQEWIGAVIGAAVLGFLICKWWKDSQVNIFRKWIVLIGVGCFGMWLIISFQMAVHKSLKYRDTCNALVSVHWLARNLSSDLEDGSSVKPVDFVASFLDQEVSGWVQFDLPEHSFVTPIVMSPFPVNEYFFVGMSNGTTKTVRLDGLGGLFSEKN